MGTMIQQHKLTEQDYLYKFTGKPIKGFGLHLDYKPYLDILQNDIQEDLARLLHHSNTI
jgi:hypothetical protein